MAILNADPVGQSSSNESLFVWIDILGFSDALEDKEQYKKLEEMLKSFVNSFNRIDNCEVKQIGDGVIIILNSLENTKIDIFFKTLATKQLEFIAQHKYFIRGAIALGEKNTEDVLISNGLSRAVKMETRDIDWPIIGINSVVLNEIQIKLTREDNLKLVRSYNNKGEDIYFVDFLQSVEYKKNISFLELCIEKISDHKENYKVRYKYIWLLKYCFQKLPLEINNKIKPELEKQLEGLDIKILNNIIL